MYSKKIFADKISQHLAKRVFPDQPKNLYEPIDYILDLSGKRIRPLLVLLSADLFSANDIDEALPLCLAIEYFHNFTLIHDDIMDKAPLRRGHQTVHHKWNDSIAILSGDALLIKAYEQLTLCRPAVIPSLLKIFNRVALEVCEGQQLDMDFESITDIQQDQYIHMIRLKTSVLLGGALELGAVIANATDENKQKIYDFGVNLGIAFQLQDDILDAYGDPDSFGKQVGGDIIVNKKTILHILLRESVQGKDVDLFAALLDLSVDHALEKIAKMKSLYTDYKVLDKANEIKQYYTFLAYNSLAEINVSDDRKAMLLALADQLMHRKQ